MQMAGNSLIWKTVIVTEDHLDNSDNQIYWATFLGINNQTDFDQYAYVCIFDGNGATGDYAVDIIAFYSNNYCSFIRKDYTNARDLISYAPGSTSYSLLASQGTNIYILKVAK